MVLECHICLNLQRPEISKNINANDKAPSADYFNFSNYEKSTKYLVNLFEFALTSFTKWVVEISSALLGYLL